MTCLPPRILSTSKLANIVGVGRHELDELANSAARRYRRRTTETGRSLAVPDAWLMDAQSQLLAWLQEGRLPGGLNGAQPGSSIKDNAAPHASGDWMVKFDVENFFGSVSHRRIYRLLRNVIGCSRPVARTVTALTTLDGALPQGAPTSPLLAALAFLPAFTALRRMAVKRRLKLTVWIDDVALSGRRAVASLPRALDIVTRHGFRIAEGKTSVMSPVETQVVTGVAVSRDELRVPEPYLNALADELSLAEALSPSLLGKINFVRYMNPVQALELEAMSGWRQLTIQHLSG